MTTLRRVVCMVMVLQLAESSRAGVYLPPNYGPFPVPPDYRLFKLRSDDRQALVMTAKKRPSAEERNKSRVLNEAWEDIEALEKKRAAKTLTVEEGIRLGGYYLLVRDHANEALEVLTEIKEREPNNFMLLGNLATAYFLLGFPDRAVLAQTQMLDPKVWPQSVEGWPPGRLRWQRRVEQLYLTFLRNRAEQSRLDPRGQPANTLRLEPLFPTVRFVGRDGKFTAGDIDPRQMDKLPPDALAMVQQIILWLPKSATADLTWLLAELFNAQGEIRPALVLLDVLTNDGIKNAELTQRRRVLQEAVASLPAEKQDSTQPDVPPPEDDGLQKSGLPDWRTFGIGVGVGLLVGVLLVLQLQVLFRPRR